MAQAILEMAKDLVMAQIQTGSLPLEDMRKELHKTYASLVELKIKEEGGAIGVDQDGETAYEPTGWKKSISKYTITCLECGASFKQLSVRHLKDHDMDARAYRAKYGIPRTQPLSAKDTTALRKKIVQQSRPWEKAPTYMKAQEAKAENSRKPKVTRKKAVPKKRPAAAKA